MSSDKFQLRSRRVAAFAGNKNKSIFDPRYHDSVNEFISALRNLRVVQGLKPGLHISRNYCTLVVPFSSASGGNGGPLKHYDKNKKWKPGDRVVVYPTDELVTDGLLDEETEEVLKAPAGIYCCQKSAGRVAIPETDPVEYRYNAPKWPTETADDLEAINTYWWLESLYPATVTKCINGTVADSYENTQPVPEQPD